MRPGWVTPYIDDTGWTGTDSVVSKLGNWNLVIGALGIAVQSGGDRLWIGAYGLPAIDREAFACLLERAMAGDKLSFKALYLMVYNDSARYGEYAPTVQALLPQYQ